MASIYKVSGPEGVVSYRTGSRDNVVGSVAVLEALPEFATDNQRKRYVRGLLGDIKDVSLSLHRNGSAEYGDYTIERINVDAVKFDPDTWTATVTTAEGLTAESGDVQAPELGEDEPAEEPATVEQPAEEPAVSYGSRW